MTDRICYYIRRAMRYEVEEPDNYLTREMRYAEVKDGFRNYDDQFYLILDNDDGCLYPVLFLNEQPRRLRKEGHWTGTIRYNNQYRCWVA